MNARSVAQQQLRNVGKIIGLDEDMHRILFTPRMYLTVVVPIRHDDGHIHVYTAYCVQHSTTRGSAKGGIR